MKKNNWILVDTATTRNFMIVVIVKPKGFDFNAFVLRIYPGDLEIYNNYSCKLFRNFINP